MSNLTEILVQQAFCITFKALAIIKSLKTWLCKCAPDMYFYIRNNAITGQRKRNREAKVRQVSNNKDFYLFFIWQAIVRGQLFLQKTFFLLYTYLPVR